MIAYRLVDRAVERVEWDQSVVLEPLRDPMADRLVEAERIVPRLRRRMARGGTLGRRTARRVLSFAIPRFREQFYRRWLGHIFASSDNVRVVLYLPEDTEPSDEHARLLSIAVRRG